MTDLTDDLISLFISNRYYDIVKFSFVLCLSQLSCAERLVLSLTHFQLGKLDPCLRELAIAIETCHTNEERDICINYLAAILSRMDREPPKQLQLESFRSTTFGILSLPSNLSSNISLSAKNYQEIGGGFPSLSIGKLSNLCEPLCQATIEEIMRPSQNNFPNTFPLSKFFKVILYMPPNFFLDTLMLNWDKISMYMKSSLKFYPEILPLIYSGKDLQQPNLEILIELLNEVSPIRFSSIIDIVISFELITATFHYYNQNFANAILIYEWLIELFNNLLAQKPFSLWVDQSECFSYTTKQVILLRLVDCLYKNGSLNQYHSDRLLNMLLSNEESMILAVEYANGRLGHFFSACGKLYEQQAYCQSTSINISNDIEDKTQALRLDALSIEEMMRKFIIAATASALDDCTIISYYNQILWGVLVHGGLHINCLYIFTYIRDYFLLKLENGCFYTIPGKDILHDFENSYKIIDLMANCVRETQVIRTRQLTCEKSVSILIPQTYIKGNSLISSEVYLDDRLHTYIVMDFCKVNPDKIRPILKGQLKLNEELIQEQITKSQSLISLWQDSYKLYNGKIPREIELIIDQYGI